MARMDRTSSVHLCPRFVFAAIRIIVIEVANRVSACLYDRKTNELEGVEASQPHDITSYPNYLQLG